ncbi:MAG: phytanoyl-CoA dioxygenase family protein [Verrucomicrobiota bacterium]
MPETTSQNFSQSGYTVFKAGIDSQTISTLTTEVEALRAKHNFNGGLRHLTQLSKGIADCIHKLNLQLYLDVIDLPNAFLVRSILLDKTHDSNWKVAWHQDTKVPIKEKVETIDFTAWSSKDGILHAQPPASILAGMRTLRIHIDDTPADNGALRLVPGSHQKGIFNPSEIKSLSQNEITCECAAGDILAMSPLILHASSPSKSVRHRRVIHLEFANQALPAPLNWAIA